MRTGFHHLLSLLEEENKRAAAHLERGILPTSRPAESETSAVRRGQPHKHWVNFRPELTASNIENMLKNTVHK